ncbi:MAG: ATP-binding protein [Eubacteriales bacterium]|nr:ATP-binding protein [Eubacteriales bacterium]
MKELSLNILDIAQNSIKAEASLVEIYIDEANAWLTLIIKDNGYGMSEAFLREVCDPFSTTRTTRKVGLGIPLLKLAAEQTGGTLSITSVTAEADKEHCGTTVRATFFEGHLDFTPLGDVVSTVVMLLLGSPDVDFVFRHTTDKGVVELDTRQMREILGDEVPLNDPSVLEWAKESLMDQYNSTR